MRGHFAKTSPQSNSPLRVFLIDETVERAALLKQALQHAGCNIAAHVFDSSGLPELVRELKPDVIILDTE